MIDYSHLKSDVITILKLRPEVIDKAKKLANITEDTKVSNMQANIANNLYKELQEMNEPMKFKFPPFCEEQASEFSLGDAFKNPKRVICLRKWVLEVLPIIDLFNRVGKLPLTRGNDNFIGYLQEVFNAYLTALEGICSSTLEAVITSKDLEHVKNLCKKIIDSLKQYYKGFPSEAFKELYKGLINNVSIHNHFKYMIKLPNFENEVFYKMRKGTEQVFTSEEMFHIPLEHRGKAATNRYSIPGLPCVYLGSSPLTCWEELNKPDLNTIQTSLFVSNSINYLDLSTPPVVFLNKLIKKFNDYGTIMKKRLFADELNEPNEVISYIIIWPLMAACSVRVKDIEDTFKPEYIISQLLLQFIRQDDFINGVSYFSTKIDYYSAETASLYRNFAFPVRGEEVKGYCPYLRNHFINTNGVPWDLFQMYKNTNLAIPNETKTQARLEFIKGMEVPYIATDFCILETFLLNYLIKEQGNEHQLIPIPSDITLA